MPLDNLAGDIPPSVEWENVNPFLRQSLEPLMPYLEREDKDHVEVSINGEGWIHIEKVGVGYVAEEAPWITKKWAWGLCEDIANCLGRKFDVRLPKLDATLPGKHRLAALLGPNVQSGIFITIRVRRLVERTFQDFNLTREQIDRLTRAVIDGENILVVGGTNTGKTSFLNLLITLIPLADRILSAQDVDELIIPHANQAKFLISRTDAATDITYHHIIDTLTRGNPYRTLLGEISTHNAPAAARMLTLGAKGFLGTVHGDTELDGMDGWRMNVELSPDGKGMNAAAVLRAIARHIDLVVLIKREGTDRRVVKNIAHPDTLNWKELV